MRPLLVVAATVATALSLGTLHARQVDADASNRRFEAASVRTTSDRTSGSFTTTQSAFIRRNIRLKALIALGLGIDESRLVGNQAVLEKHYDVAATMVPPASPQDVRAMVRNLLVDRFALRIREELREQPVFFLSRINDASLGPRLQPVKIDCAAKNGLCFTTSGGPWLIMETGRDWAAIALAERLSGPSGRVVIDKTGLAGQYNIRLEWNSTLTAARDTTSGEQALLSTAIREQLGLRLESGSARVPMWVIDDVREPTDN